MCGDTHEVRDLSFTLWRQLVMEFLNLVFKNIDDLLSFMLKDCLWSVCHAVSPTFF